MSASLVGSEMCIRDSLAPLWGGYRPRGPPGWRLQREWPLRGATAPRAPVSYTHLTLPTICSV
eukprot:15096505-Alexandrium_andersonii.AAC.1